MLSEEIKNIKESNKDLRKFGITVGVVLIMIAAFLFWKQHNIYFYFGIAGVFLFLAGLIIPIILKPINKAWMTLAIIMGWVMTRVILTILFFIILTPVGFLSKLFRKDFLNQKIDHNKDTYWEIREKKKFAPEDYEKQF